jgi:23S rRNA maturation mini-RNase III
MAYNGDIIFIMAIRSIYVKNTGENHWVTSGKLAKNDGEIIM